MGLLCFNNSEETSKMKFAKYIVLTEDKTEVRFFAIGTVDKNDAFTGIMHDYTGSGNYEERLVFKNKWIPTEIDGEPLDWDEEVEIFNSISHNSVDEIETAMDKFICYDTDKFNYVPQNGMMRYFSDNGVLVDNMSLWVPYGLGNTTFSDGYEIDETMSFNDIKKAKEIKTFIQNLDRADAIRIDSSPLLEFWEVSLDEPYDLISTSWDVGDQTWTYGLNEDNIREIEFENNSYLIATRDTSYSTKITLYGLSALDSDDDTLEEVELHEERANRTLHGLKNGLAYYNYEGVHFRVFNSFEDGLHWLDNGDDDLVIAEFENEQELDSYLGAKL